MIESMEVTIPSTLEIRASGTKIAELSKYGNNEDLYLVDTIDQKMELISFCEMLTKHFATLNRKVYQVLLEANSTEDDKTVIWVYLDKDHLPTVRKLSDNPQA